MKNKQVHHLETIAPGRMVSIWALATSDPLEHVLRPEYFDQYLDRGLRTHDRLIVVSNMLEQAEHAWLRVVSTSDNIITVQRES